jgi:hypothetical protein
MKDTRESNDESEAAEVKIKSGWVERDILMARE